MNTTSERFKTPAFEAEAIGTRRNSNAAVRSDRIGEDARQRLATGTSILVRAPERVGAFNMSMTLPTAKSGRKSPLGGIGRLDLG
jgi:hypothetical protein